MFALLQLHTNNASLYSFSSPVACCLQQPSTCCCQGLPSRASIWPVACSLSSRLLVVAAGALILNPAAYASLHQPFRTATPTLRPRVGQQTRKKLGRVGNTRFALRANKWKSCLVRNPLRLPLEALSTPRHLFGLHSVTVETLSPRW